MQRIKTGDTVEVIAGRELGERGEVLAVMPKEERVVIDGVNIMKRHQRARQQGSQQIQAQIVEFAAPIHLSNVMPVCASCDERTRVGFRIRESDGHKVRVCKKCGADMD